MTVRLNDRLLLWGLAVLQPASPGDVLRFIRMIFPEVSDVPAVKDVQPTVDRWVEEGNVIRVYGRSKLYSLTAKGNHLMPIALRRTRDRARVFLLKEARAAKVSMSGDAPQRLAGASPAVNGSSGIQEGARPISPAAAPREARSNGRSYWPRVVKQLQVGSSWPSPDIFFELYSFPSLHSVHLASDNPAGESDLSISDLGLAIGVSPRLLTSFIHRPTNHYREFRIGKRGGGERTISAPRLFLKTVQYWLLDYVLWRLPQHHCSHAYRAGLSIVTNAQAHVGKMYVANVDIKDFFPSIQWEAVAKTLRAHGCGPKLASAVARLTSLRNGLPQGAPTSPVLSNVYLLDIDASISRYCEKRKLVYTRYADDITISGDEREYILAAIDELRGHLAEKRLILNEKKTRIASRSGQQKVTGVVVNVKAQPPREYRRRVRAMLHQAKLDPALALRHMAEVRGHVNYLSSFPVLKDSPEMATYRRVLGELSK